MRKVLLLATLLVSISALSAWAADISGKWTLTMWGAGAEESIPIVIKAAGENLTVTCSHPSFKEMTGTGTLKGDAISFSLKSASMEIKFSGKVAGNKMEGTREISSSGAREGAPGGAAGGPPGGAPGGAAGGPPGDQGGPPGDAAGGPPGGQGGAPGGAPGGPQGDQGGAQAQSSENWTAVKD